MNEENLYEILGVSETATTDEIKKAYREKSKVHHPDKGGSEDTFKKINEAYSTLSDQNKRNQYDNRKNNPFMGGFESNGFHDIFEQMFNFNNNPFSRKNKNNFADKIIELVVTPEESFLSSSKTITYERKDMCNSCNGRGGDKIQCQTCQGQGFFAQTVSNGMFHQVFRTPCHSCQAKGYTLTNTCRSCNGSGSKNSIESISIQLPHGIDEGQFLKVENKGDYNNGYGNLLLKIRMEKTNFEKSDLDLIYTTFFNLEDLQKDSFDVPHPSGSLNIKFPKEFDTMKPLRVKGKGFQGQKLGDLYVKMNVRFTRKD